MIYRWTTDNDITLGLDLKDPTGAGATGKTPEIGIRRHRVTNGAALDDYWWDDVSDFQAGVNWISMVEFDAVNYPGLYIYTFPNVSIGEQHTYLVLFRHTVAPVGFFTEEHVVSNEQSTQIVGSRQITVHVDDANPLPLPGVFVDIYAADNATFLGRGTTDTNGDAVFALDDATYNVRLLKAGYSFTVPENLVVAADATANFSGTPAAVSAPSDPSLCVIFGTIRNVGGIARPGLCVEAFASPTPQDEAGAQYSDNIAKTATDENGYFELELVRNTEVRFTVQNTGYNSLKTVPDLASQDITTWA